jgi:hypothetical protein
MVGKRKKKVGAGHRRIMRGGAWYDDLWSGVKKVAGPINDVLKATKIGSTLASTYNPAAGAVLSQLGYGRRGGMHGRGVMPSIILA